MKSSLREIFFWYNSTIGRFSLAVHLFNIDTKIQHKAEDTAGYLFFSNVVWFLSGFPCFEVSN